jgi:membrane-bound lytic murein transglycosylase B
MTRRIALALLGLSIAVAPAAAQSDFRACLAGLKGQAVAKGVPGEAYDAAVAGVQPDMKILELMDNQPEFKTPIWDYLGFLVDDERVEEGRAAVARDLVLRAEPPPGLFSRRVLRDDADHRPRRHPA